MVYEQDKFKSELSMKKVFITSRPVLQSAKINTAKVASKKD